MGSIAQHLANTVIVKDSIFRPKVEQKARSEDNAIQFIFRDFDMGKGTIGEFVEMYARRIEELALISKNGRMNKFNLDVSDLENLYGVKQNNTLNLEEGHPNFLNRILNYLH